jgi:hypothetical protein
MRRIYNSYLFHCAIILKSICIHLKGNPRLKEKATNSGSVKPWEGQNKKVYAGKRLTYVYNLKYMRLNDVRLLKVLE